LAFFATLFSVSLGSTLVVAIAAFFTPRIFRPLHCIWVRAFGNRLAASFELRGFEQAKASMGLLVARGGPKLAARSLLYSELSMF
jgi:hypothetical protein